MLMKRTISIILAAILLLSFSACDTEQSPSVSDGAEETPVEISTEMSADEWEGACRLVWFFT